MRVFAMEAVNEGERRVFENGRGRLETREHGPQWHLLASKANPN